MYAKAKITGKIELITGLHIGCPSSFSAIGAVDSPIAKDVRNGNPVIPGSSLKGKLRTLLAKAYNENIAKTPDDDDKRLTSLFGSSKKDNIQSGRLIFSDMMLSNWEELKKEGLTSKTEIKFENTISRTTAEANPRQIERAIRGSQFDLEIIYDVISKEKMKDDFEIITEGLKILQYDYLGGSGTRGYGKVKFKDLKVEIVVGNKEELSDTLQECQAILDNLDKEEEN